MIESRVHASGRVTVPPAVSEAVGLKPSDDLAWNIEGDRAAVMRVADTPDRFVINFSTFIDRASEADCKAFDHL